MVDSVGGRITARFSQATFTTAPRLLALENKRLCNPAPETVQCELILNWILFVCFWEKRCSTHFNTSESNTRDPRD